MKKLILGLSVLVAAAMLVPGAAHTAAFHELFTQDIEVFDTIFNPCTGEPVTLSGIVQFRLQNTFTANGGLDFYMHFNNQGISGIGASGTLYEFAGSSDLSGHLDVGADGTVANVSTQGLLIAHGDAPNAIILEEFHFTIDANGELVVTLDRFTATCH